jgi:hypothetical protein
VDAKIDNIFFPKSLTLLYLESHNSPKTRKTSKKLTYLLLHYDSASQPVPAEDYLKLLQHERRKGNSAAEFHFLLS